MKSTILTIGGLLMAVNILSGMLLSAYAPFNMWMNTVVIAVTTSLVYLVNSIGLKDAFKVSLTILLPITGAVKLLLGFFAPERIEDNWCVIVCVLVTVLEVIMLIAVHKTSKII